jgi:hypothetical protein
MASESTARAVGSSAVLRMRWYASTCLSSSAHFSHIWLPLWASIQGAGAGVTRTRLTLWVCRDVADSALEARTIFGLDVAEAVRHANNGRHIVAMVLQKASPANLAASWTA